MPGPHIQTVRKARHGTRRLQHAGHEISRTVICRGKVVVRPRRAAHVVEHHRGATLQNGTYAPHQGQLPARGIVPQMGQYGCYPRRGIVVADIEYHELASVDPDAARLVDISAPTQILVIYPPLGISFRRRVVLPEGSIGHGAVPYRVGILECVVGADQTAELPLRSHILMAAARMTRIFVCPRGESPYVAHTFPFI